MKAGAVIGGRYRLAALIGEGGMASVWRAHDETLARPVAIKLLYMRSQRDVQASVDQFLREARLTASVQHRNVIQTVDFGVTPEQVPFMVMELLHGETLADRFVREPALGIDELLHLAGQTLRGLSAVHGAGIVHRDLKPHNVFLQRDADAVYPKILDFGISRSLGAGPASAIATQEGLIVGTPDYMAPEQARGERDIDRRADIYSMGAILYEGICGCVPFEAQSIGELIVKIATSTPPPVRSLRSDVPEPVSACIAQAMSLDRQQRFADAAAFREALARAAEQAYGPAAAREASDAPPRRLRPAAAEQQLSAAGAAGSGVLVKGSPAAGPGAAWSASAPALSASASTGAWGELEAPSLRAERHASAAGHAVARHSLSPADQARAHAPGPSAIPDERALRAVLDRGEPANRQSVRTGAAKAGRPSTGRAHEAPQVVHDDMLFGDDPLDSFASQSAGSLELDFAHAPAAAARASAAGHSATRAQPRSHVAPNIPARALRRSQPSAAIWLLPILLSLGFGLLLFMPALFSLPAPDTAAATQRQAQNPATFGGSTWGVRPRRKLDEVAPAERDVTF
jgi:tRNA A-37 threonylcarbamoyl transferase component Bud32